MNGAESAETTNTSNPQEATLFMQTGNDPDSRGYAPGNGLIGDEIALPPLHAELEYLIEPGIEFGRKYQFYEDAQSFAENGEESELETLATIGERARLSGDYRRFQEWWYEIDEVLEQIVDERYPYTVHVPPERRPKLLRLINEADDRPEVAARLRERRLRSIIEAEDDSDVVQRRREMRMRLIDEINDKVHHMDIHFLFGVMDACGMELE
jgi:hypothetical protein